MGPAPWVAVRVRSGFMTTRRRIFYLFDPVAARYLRVNDAFFSYLSLITSTPILDKDPEKTKGQRPSALYGHPYVYLCPVGCGQYLCSSHGGIAYAPRK
jgi:hypothetical protein